MGNELQQQLQALGFLSELAASADLPKWVKNGNDAATHINQISEARKILEKALNSEEPKKPEPKDFKKV